MGSCIPQQLHPSILQPGPCDHNLTFHSQRTTEDFLVSNSVLLMCFLSQWPTQHQPETLLGTISTVPNFSCAYEPSA